MRTPLAMAFADSWHRSFETAESDRRANYGDGWAEKVKQAMKSGISDIAQSPALTVSALLSALTLRSPPTRITTGTASWLVFKPLSKLSDRTRDSILYAMSFGAAKEPLALEHGTPPEGVVSHITIKVSNLSQSIAFYQKFGFSLVGEPTSSQAMLKGGAHKKWQPLLLLSSTGSPLKRPESWSAGMQRLCIYVADFDVKVGRLKAAGLEPYAPLAGKSEQIAAYKDPDGFVVYLIVFHLPLGPIVDITRLWYGAQYPMMFHLSINVASDFETAKSSYAKLGFSKVVYEVGRDKHQKNLLPAFGLSESETHIDGVRMCQLPNDVFSITLLKWTEPETKREGGEMLNSLAITVKNVKEAVRSAREAGFEVEEERLTKVPLLGEAIVGAAFVEGVRIEYVKFLD